MAEGSKGKIVEFSYIAFLHIQYNSEKISKMSFHRAHPPYSELRLVPCPD